MAYTAAQVDDLIVKFERCAQRQSANKGSTVKLRAAERDLLGVAEQARDVLLKAVKGDKDLLQSVFGGSCERFHRFKQVMETVELSEMHANDQRWGHLKDAILTIEEVLKQLGMFKPWQLGLQAPESIEYKSVRSRFSPGEKVKLLPEIEGGEPTMFTVEPALPEGLTLVESTGEIKGLLRPDVELEETTYVITGSNDKGETKSELTFSVKVPPPESLEYKSVPDSIFTCEAISWEAATAGGPVKAWSVTPDLPRGLELDSGSGELCGTALDVADSKEYCITASNGSGEVKTTISFGVLVAPPVSLTYPDAHDGYPVGGVIYLAPLVTLKSSPNPSARRRSAELWKGLQRKVRPRATAVIAMPKMTFSVEPALPDGLALVPTTGVITGKPTKPSEEVVHKVKVVNDGGEMEAELPLAVVLIPPSDLTYPEASGEYFTGDPIMLSPEVEGLVEAWLVEPALPEGLQLDPSMGMIAGTPTTPVPESSWTLTARNAEGEATTVLTFAVKHAPPSNLSYPGLVAVYPMLRKMSLAPRVDGHVVEFSVSPALPDGLALDVQTGTINGMPTGVSEEAAYEVTASNDTGASTTTVTFGVQLMPPAELTYPRIDDMYMVNEAVLLEPDVEGGAESWEVEPALPEGLTLDAATGQISGSPTVTSPEASYVVTASNEAGGTSVVLTFAILAPPPSGLSYPNAGSDYVVGEELLLEADLEVGVCSTFSITPALPDGLVLDPETGAISGTPTAESDFTTYKVTTTNIAGTTDCELAFACSEPVEVIPVDQQFAAMIESITDLAEMVEEPAKSKTMSDWMVWMVHRAYLNDPSLTDFNFNNLQMPLPHLEPRVAPKLMESLKRNTYIISLQLVNANLQKPQGHQLAESLKANTTLKVLNIESNNVDSESIRVCAAALQENPDSALESWRFDNQKHVGRAFGRPVEQALAELMEFNLSITKLGFACNDPHWRNEIDRSIMRNIDMQRRRRKHSMGNELEEVAAEEKPLSKIIFMAPPEKAIWEVFEDDDEKSKLVTDYMVKEKRFPTKVQLQSFAKSAGKPLKYSEVAPLVRDFRASLFDAAVETEVTAVDAYGTEVAGIMRAWSEKNENWSLDVWPSDGGRFNFTLNKQPVIEVAEAFGDWLNGDAF